MTAETENLVLDLPIWMRAEIALSKDDVAGIRERIDPDTTGYRARIAALQGAPA